MRAVLCVERLTLCDIQFRKRILRIHHIKCTVFAIFTCLFVLCVLFCCCCCCLELLFDSPSFSYGARCSLQAPLRSCRCRRRFLCLDSLRLIHPLAHIRYFIEGLACCRPSYVSKSIVFVYVRANARPIIGSVFVWTDGWLAGWLKLL